MGELEVTYMNRKKLRSLASFFRRMFRLGDEPCLDVLGILERNLIKLDSEFNYEVPEKWEYGPNIHALCDIGRHVIFVREDVYNGAYCGKGRDRLTIMHEVAHYFLFTFFGCPVFRSFQNSQHKIPDEKDPEWQATNLAGFIMCPDDIIKGLTANEVARKCGISSSAAKAVCNIRDEERQKETQQLKKKKAYPSPKGLKNRGRQFNKEVGCKKPPVPTYRGPHVSGQEAR